jgi:F-type H+-transporting ATPase subunit gamma
VLVVTADRGLAGAYSSNVLRLAERTIRDLRARTGNDVALYVSGKKGVSYFRFRGAPMAEVWTGFSEVPPYSAAEEVGRRLIEDFGSQAIDELHAVYTDFRSAFTFRASTHRFLPISPEELVPGARGRPHAEYIFEPSPAAILDELLPQYVITKVYFAMLESAASENAARQRAMAAATDNAEELMKVLTREANQARQAEITTEIMEIVGGAEALAASTTGE